MVWANKRGHNYGKNRPSGRRVFLLPFIVGIFVFLGFVIYQATTSLYLSPRNRITVGVFSEHPYVISYEKSTGIAHIVYFNPDTMTYVPGGYGWYRLGSVRLLSQIEHNNELMTRAFSYLVGAPVDGVFFEKKARTYSDEKDGDFMSYFAQNSKKHYQKYSFTRANLIDGLYMSSLFQVRASKMIAINARDFVIVRKGKNYYDGVTTDPHLKGFFYQPLFFEKSIQLAIYAPEKYLRGGRTVTRIIEGMGIKVIALEPQTNSDQNCTISHGESLETQVKVLNLYFNCRVILDKKLTSIVYLHLGRYAKLYL